MTIGAQPLQRADGRPRSTCGRSRSRSASRSGPRARAVIRSATRRSCAPPRSRTGFRPICAARAPGWVTAEYTMLPRATAERNVARVGQGPARRPDPRDPAPRRAARCAAWSTSAKLGERTITIDCDVLQADGGTRTASITGGYVALAAALRDVRHGALPPRTRCGGQRRHRQRSRLPRPRLLRGFARGGRLQRGRHGRRHVRRAAGHGRGQAVRPSGRRSAARPGRPGDWRGSSPLRPRRWPRSLARRSWVRRRRATEGRPARAAPPAVTFRPVASSRRAATVSPAVTVRPAVVAACSSRRARPTSSANYGNCWGR